MAASTVKYLIISVVDPEMEFFDAFLVKIVHNSSQTRVLSGFLLSVLQNVIHEQLEFSCFADFL